TLPRLRNDLDLVLIDPAGNRHYPWQLNQNIKSADGSRLLNPEEQTCDTDITIETQLAPPGPLNAASILPAVKAPDHLNNVEVVDAPRMTGTWMAEVTGFSVPWGPQKFSLIGVSGPPLILWTPVAICRQYPGLCTTWSQTLCQMIPDLCTFPR